MVKLYFIDCEDVNGDSLCLFVHAADPNAAVKLWVEHYKDGNEPADHPVAYDVTQTALCAGVMQWDAIPRTVHKGNAAWQVLP